MGNGIDRNCGRFLAFPHCVVTCTATGNRSATSSSQIKISDSGRRFFSRNSGNSRQWREKNDDLNLHSDDGGSVDISLFWWFQSSGWNRYLIRLIEDVEVRIDVSCFRPTIRHLSAGHAILSIRLPDQLVHYRSAVEHDLVSQELVEYKQQNGRKFFQCVGCNSRRLTDFDSSMWSSHRTGTW